MRRISITSVLRRYYFLVFVLLVAGCSLEKETGFNRGMQNITAHYNILFDANEILRIKQDAYALSFIDSYNEILSVYQDTIAQSTTPDKDLEEAKVKAGKIINIKEQSHYLPDAYLVLGKADYLEGDYFSATEFFSYVIRSFPKQPKQTEEAAVWKARTMIRLNQLPQGKLVIDSAILNINKKTKKQVIADAYATKLQYDIDVQNYEEGEQTTKQAIHYSGDKSQRLRWTFIMAQLQELNNKPQDAYANYSRIVNSNALFEMAFNASLNRIRITQNQNGIKVDRIQMLRALLKSDNNKEFTDQIYYQIAELNYADKKIDEAVKNYRLSVRHSVKNRSQKGLSYLRLADIFFKGGRDYITSKKYYDSTLMNLPQSYPGYQVIKKKSDNLQLLADRFNIVSREDTLQMLAKLDEKTRATKIDAMVNAEILRQQSFQADNNAAANSQQSAIGSGSNSGSSFYFYNSNAISQGYSDFKRRWGNRKLEDNWRRSQRASSDVTGNSAQAIDPDAPAGQGPGSKNAPTAGDFRKQLMQNLPLTPELLAKSNQRIYNAYFDIANFYRDILGDKQEAIATYELLLARFPESPDKPSLYYRLYRLYADENSPKADEYKNLLLKNYPDTPFAQIIIDPAYGQKLNDADAELTGLYNGVYDAYSKKDYQNAITLIDQLQKQKPNNKWSSQLAYLRAISQGHLEKFDPFKTDLQQLIAAYPNDKLIIPLVKQHITYLDANKDKLMPRQFVLMDSDPNEEPFIPPAVQQADKATASYNAFADQQQKAYQQAEEAKQLAAKKAADAKKAGLPVANQSVANQPVAINQSSGQPQIANQPLSAQTIAGAPALNNPLVNNAPVKAPSIFSMRDSTNYYFVVNVNNSTINLASSRFGFGQFNRANFPDGGITHQLLNVGDNNQLIYVGRFYRLSDVKDYARSLVPLLPEIMKVPKEEYTFFIITQENLDKLKNKILLDSYMDYYQNNY